MAKYKPITGDAKVDNKKSKKSIFFVIGIIAICIIITTIFIFINNNNSTSAEYEEVNKIYSANNINYSIEDYNKDKAIITEISNDFINNNSNENYKNKYNELSDAYKKQKTNNDKVINNILKDVYGNDTSDNSSENAENLNIDSTQLIAQFLTQIKKSSDYIDNHYGLESTDFTAGFNKEKQDARSIAYNDITKVEKFAQNKIKPDLEYWQIDPNTMLLGLQYSAYYLVPFSMSQSESINDSNFINYSEWFKCGHPRITSVNALSLENGFWQYGNTYYNLKATIVTDAGNFEVYTAITADSNNSYSYWFYDISQISN